MGTAVRTIDGQLNTSHNHLLAIVLPVVLVTATVFKLILIGFGIIQRRRKTRIYLEEARLREPSLTWAEYERRRNLTRSRLMFEEDLLRSAMIRKTQQSRVSARKETAAVEAVRSTRPRSRTWHGRTKSQDGDLGDGIQGIGSGWGPAQANVERARDAPHGKMYPTLEGTPPGVENDVGALQQLPTVCLKTPPLLSHPVFRGGSRRYHPRHLSLPNELIRVQTKAVIASSSTVIQ